MILYVGGSAQGKAELAKRENDIKEYFDGENGNLSLLESAEGVNKLHLAIKRLLNEGKSSEEILKLISSLKARVIICDEVGCGIVSIEREDTIYRECVGRCCCLLAGRAKRVVRVICGMGVIIK